MEIDDALESVNQADRLGAVSVTLHTAQALVDEVRRLREERARLLDEAAERAKRKIIDADLAGRVAAAVRGEGEG